MDDDVEQSPKSVTRTAARIATVVIAIVLVAAVLLYVVINARTGLAFIIVAAFLAAALNHPVQWLERRRVSRPLAITAVMTAIIGVLIGAGLLLVPTIVRQAHGLVQRWPSIVGAVRESSIYQTLDRQFNLTAQIQQSQSEWPETLRRSLDPAVKAVTSVFAVAAGFITIFFLTVFMLIFGGRLVDGALAESTPKNRVRYRRVIGKIYDSISGYLVGISFVCLVNATLATIILAILRVPFFLPLGILSGSSSLIPYAGPVVMGTTITLITLATMGLWKAGVVAIFYVLYGQLEGNVLAPLVFRRTVNVNPLVSIMSLVIFGELAGIAGAIAAVPLAAIGQIIVRELLVLRRQRLNLPLTGEAGSVEELPKREIKRLAAEDRAHKEAESSEHS